MFTATEKKKGRRKLSPAFNRINLTCLSGSVAEDTTPWPLRRSESRPRHSGSTLRLSSSRHSHRAKIASDSWQHIAPHTLYTPLGFQVVCIACAFQCFFPFLIPFYSSLRNVRNLTVCPSNEEWILSHPSLQHKLNITNAPRMSDDVQCPRLPRMAYREPLYEIANAQRLRRPLPHIT